MQATIAQSRKTFRYVREAGELQAKPFAYEKYQDYETKLSDEDLRAYIMTQCSLMDSQQKEDAKELEGEQRQLAELVEALKGRSADIEMQAKKVRDEIALSKQKIDDSKRQKMSLDEQGLQWKAQVDDLKGLVQGMEEQRNKDARQADKKNLSDIQRTMSDSLRADSVMTYILDSIVKLLEGDRNATFASHGQKYMTESAYGAAVRACKPENMDKDDLKGIAERINLNAEGQPGDIQAKLLNAEDPTRYILFFAHYKVLFKLVQAGLSIKRMSNLQRKLEANRKDVAACERVIADETAVIENLHFVDWMEQEAQRIRHDEANFLAQKKQEIDRRMSAIQRVAADDFQRNAASV